MMVLMSWDMAKLKIIRSYNAINLYPVRVTIPGRDWPTIARPMQFVYL